MDEDLEIEEQSAEMPIEGMDLQALAGTNPTLAAYIKKYEADAANVAAAHQRQAQTYKDVFEKGEKEILARRYGAPTTSEQLFALSAALASPRYYKGLAGTMSRVAPALGQMDELQRSAEAQRAEALAKLRREYLTGVADADVSSAQAQLEARGKLLSSLASATKPRAPRTGFNPITGELVNLDTNTPVTPPPPQVGEVRDGYKYLGGDPASQTSWRKVV